MLLQKASSNWVNFDISAKKIFQTIGALVETETEFGSDQFSFHFVPSYNLFCVYSNYFNGTVLNNFANILFTDRNNLALRVVPPF